MSFIKEIKDIHKGQDIYIIGKGPSLELLTAQMIGEGVIITINDSINKVESLNLSNIIYSMQKDCPGAYPIIYNTNGTIQLPKPEKCVNVEYHKKYRPKRATLLVHKHESIHCTVDYSPRMVFDNLEMGLLWHDFSWISAIKIGQLMGCNKFYFVSFDSFINGNGSDIYGYQKERIKPYLLNIDHQFITPKNDISYYTHKYS